MPQTIVAIISLGSARHVRALPGLLFWRQICLRGMAILNSEQAVGLVIFGGVSGGTVPVTAINIRSINIHSTSLGALRSSLDNIKGRKIKISRDQKRKETQDPLLGKTHQPTRHKERIPSRSPALKISSSSHAILPSILAEYVLPYLPPVRYQAYIESCIK